MSGSVFADILIQKFRREITTRRSSSMEISVFSCSRTVCLNLSIWNRIQMLGSGKSLSDFYVEQNAAVPLSRREHCEQYSRAVSAAIFPSYIFFILNFSIFYQ